MHVTRSEQCPHLKNTKKEQCRQLVSFKKQPGRLPVIIVARPDLSPFGSVFWDEKKLGIEKDFELMGMEKRRLLRLRPDYIDAKGWKPASRVDFMAVVAREALTQGNCEVIGGFVRDWIIRGEDNLKDGTPKDIDLRLWKGFDLSAFSDRCCSKWGLVRDDRNSKMGFKTPSDEWFFIDYIFTESFEQGGDLKIDLDIYSLAFSADLGPHKRAYVTRPLCKTYGNIKRKVAYLVENNPKKDRCEYMSARVKKMQSRGWKVIRAKSLEKNCDC